MSPVAHRESAPPSLHPGRVLLVFSRATDASKVALVALVGMLRERDFMLLDTQFKTDHLAQFGTHEMPRDAAVDRPRVEGVDRDGQVALCVCTGPGVWLLTGR